MAVGSKLSHLLLQLLLLSPIFFLFLLLQYLIGFVLCLFLFPLLFDKVFIVNVLFWRQTVNLGLEPIVSHLEVPLLSKGSEHNASCLQLFLNLLDHVDDLEHIVLLITVQSELDKHHPKEQKAFFLVTIDAHTVMQVKYFVVELVGSIIFKPSF